MNIYKQADITSNKSAYILIKPNKDALSLVLNKNEYNILKRDLNATEVFKMPDVNILPRSEFDEFFKSIYFFV